MKIILRALRLLKPYRTQLQILLVLNILIAALDVIPSFIFKFIVDLVTENPSDPSILSHIFLLIGTYFGLQFLNGIFLNIEWYFSILWRNKVRINLTTQVSSEAYQLQQQFFQNRTVGEVVEKLNYGINELTKIYFFYPRNLLAPLSKGIFAFTIIGTIDYRIALVLGVLIPPYVFFFHKRMQAINEFQPERREQEEKASGKLTEALYSLETTKVNSSPKFVISGIERYFLKALSLLRKRLLKEQVASFITNRIEELSLTLALSMTIYLIYYGDLTLGSLVLVAALNSYLLTPLRQILRQQLDLQETIIGLERFFEILNAPKESDHFSGTIKPTKLDGRIEFNNVWFAYDKNQNALKNVSLVAKSGETVSLVGPSGSGKTTITKLITGLYVPSKGTITIDGQPITEYDLHTLRQHMAVVFQEPFVFSDTFKNNLKFVKPNATNKEIDRVITLANIKEFVNDLPKGLNTQVGERGVKLSGGQKQRLAIAQAFLKDAKIIIFDEATSALDAENERLIQEAMRRLMADRTTFIISHRLATVLHADQILVLKNGRIVEQGTHRELKKAGGVYDTLYTLQMRDPEKLEELDLI